MKKLILWAIGIALFIYVMEVIGDHSKEDCETRISQEFKSETKWVNGRCYVKDWGRTSR
jgi:hypothetical protein